MPSYCSWQFLLIMIWKTLNRALDPCHLFWSLTRFLVVFRHVCISWTDWFVICVLVLIVVRVLAKLVQKVTKFSQLWSSSLTFSSQATEMIVGEVLVASNICDDSPEDPSFQLFSREVSPGYQRYYKHLHNLDSILSLLSLYTNNLTIYFFAVPFIFSKLL